MTAPKFKGQEEGRVPRIKGELEPRGPPLELRPDWRDKGAGSHCTPERAPRTASLLIGRLRLPCSLPAGPPLAEPAGSLRCSPQSSASRGARGPGNGAPIRAREGPPAPDPSWGLSHRSRPRECRVASSSLVTQEG